MSERRTELPKTTCDSSAEERRLVQRLLVNDTGAWRDFVHRFQSVVAARAQQTICHCLGSAREADRDDLVAEVFATLIQNDKRALRKFSFDSSIATWLTVITHRRCLRYVTVRRRQAEQSTLSTRELHNGIEDGPLGKMVDEENRLRLRQEMKQLRQSDQRVLELFYFDSLGYREIGNRLGISTNAVGPKLHRAQQRLKRLMEERS